MADEPVARRYAQAMLEVGLERDNYEQLRREVDDLAQVYTQSKVFRTVLLDPSITLEERRQTLRAIADKRQWSQAVTNFGLILLDNDRFRVAPTIARSFGDMVDAQSGEIRADVTSAAELDQSQQNAIKGALAEITGKHILLETDVDPSLLGGAVARIGSTVYDGSVKSQIERLRNSILAEV